MDTLSAYIWWFVDAGISCILAVIMLGLIARLVSLGIDEVEIIMKSGTDMAKEQAAAVRLIVQKKRKLLIALILLVLCSVAAIQALGIHLEVVVFSFVVVEMFAVVYLLIFGKVITQRVFRRFGVAVSAQIVGPVRVCYPPAQAGNDGELNPHLTHVVLDLTAKTAKDVMIPIESTFSVSLAADLDWEVIGEIIAKGYSYVPVYSTKPTNILCVVKTENLRNQWVPEAKIPVTSLPIIRVPSVLADTPLHEVFTLLRQRGAHMATVAKDVTGPLTHAQVQLLLIEGRDVGIITFQDVIQELLKDKPVLATMIKK